MEPNWKIKLVVEQRDDSFELSYTNLTRNSRCFHSPGENLKLAL